MAMGRFRKQHRQLTDDEKALIEEIKDGAQALEASLEKMENSREKSLALTNLEQAIMWSTQGITS
ncbi:MAG: hypothetical protein AAFZ74_02045 [Pseudomonadota bacterium]